MNFIVGNEDVSKRLDIYLSEKIKDATRSYIKTLIDDEKITVNGKVVKSGYKLKVGDEILKINGKVVSEYSEITKEIKEE